MTGNTYNVDLHVKMPVKTARKTRAVVAVAEHRRPARLVERIKTEAGGFMSMCI